MDKIYTVGHSIQSIDEFYEMLYNYGINCIIDVRSIPFSQRVPQFNKEVLKQFLNRCGIIYAHFGTEFGARRTDCLIHIIKDGIDIQQVNFEKGTTTFDFQRGIQRLNNALSQGRTICLMCTESNPLDCHRFSFISRYLYDNNYDVAHIVRDKLTKKVTLKSHKELEICMIKEYLSKKNHELREVGTNLFGESYSKEEQRRDAYLLKNRDIGFIPTQPDEDVYD
ncbi:DUF488 domain-containing protein [uncultured Bacteroides sp.]|uniref:DUF488 domain-containing protein n=1 Tax=uncultured Bacteroides sp. TaxID=162156 RepID=UPI002638EB71|nr:DUF488 domain-containing protein [uncultured Bacteroides sp.]